MLNISSWKTSLNHLKLWKLLQFLVLLFFLSLNPLMTPIANARSTDQAQTTGIITAYFPEQTKFVKALAVMDSISCRVCHVGLNYKKVTSDHSSSFLSDHFLLVGRINHEFLPVLSASSSEPVPKFMMTL